MDTLNEESKQITKLSADLANCNSTLNVTQNNLTVCNANLQEERDLVAGLEVQVGTIAVLQGNLNDAE